VSSAIRTMPGTTSRNSLSPGWKPYEWRKTPGWNPAALATIAGPGRPPNWGHLPPTRHPSCGESRGWWSHRRRGEKPCEGCREAHNATRRKGTPPGRPRRSECGSEAGYRRHLTDGTLVCDQCREAVNAVNRERYAVAPCRACGYLKTARGHRAECGGAA
jgi:hypothetical protein